MILFWMVVLCSGFVYFFMREKSDTIIMQLNVLAFVLLFGAIITKDPLFAQFGVPSEFEWVVGLFIAAFMSWKWYFNPMKERLIKTEKAVERLESEFGVMKGDIILIKEHLLGTKKNSVGV